MLGGTHTHTHTYIYIYIYIYIAKNKLDNIFEGNFEKNNISDLEKLDNLNLKVPVDDIQEEDYDLTICL